jgi:hypothetical protein
MQIWTSLATLSLLLVVTGGIHGCVSSQRQAQHDGATADHAKAVELKPSEPEAYYKRGLSHTEAGRHDCAIADYTRSYPKTGLSNKRVHPR